MTLKNIARTYLFEYSHCFDIQIPDDISTETSENDEELPITKNVKLACSRFQQLTFGMRLSKQSLMKIQSKIKLI